MAIQPRALEQLQLINIRTPAQLDAAASTTGIDLGAIDGDALFILHAGASASATGIKAKLQHADTVDGEYSDVPGGAFADLVPAASAQKLSVDRSVNKKFFRVNFNTETGSYDALVGCSVIGPARYAT
jgi:hypothetical protein